MAWTKTSVRGYLVATDTVTFTASTDDKSTTVIDWIKPGQDFVVIANTAAANTTANADVDIDCCMTSDGTFAILKADLIVDTIVSNARSAVYDASLNGEAPYYKIRFDPDATMGAVTITVAVITTV